MKKIKSKIKEARQFVNLIKSNTTESIEKSNKLLDNIKKKYFKF